MSRRRASSPGATECRRRGSGTLAEEEAALKQCSLALPPSLSFPATTFHRRYKLHISVRVGGDDFVEAVQSLVCVVRLQETKVFGRINTGLGDGR